MNIIYNRNSTISITSDILIGSGAADGHYSTYYDYDRMGNITTLVRIGLTDGAAYSIIDNLDCAYEGNRLTKVEDSAGSGQPTYYGAFHFDDGADSDLEYAYDANGNMTKDLNKDITEIKYNLMNLPKKVTNRSGMESFTYSAAGEKLAMTYSIYMHAGGLYAYCGNFIYHNGGLNHVLVDGGYITFTGWNPQYHFYLTDHLGNNRVVVNAGGTVEQVNHYYPYGGLMGESSGGDAQPYKYNGKELDRTNGLDWYDYGARHMDAALGRFTTMDPLCEKYYNISPYAYCKDNPIINIDPDGRFVLSKEQAKKYPRLNLYLQKGIQGILDNPKIMHALRVAGRFTNEQIKEMVTYGQGPTINVTPLESQYGFFISGINSTTLNIDEYTVNELENAEGFDAVESLFFIGVTILHEFSHYGDDLAGNPEEDREDGEVYEKNAYGIVINKSNVKDYLLDYYKKKSNKNDNKKEIKEEDDEKDKN